MIRLSVKVREYNYHMSLANENSSFTLNYDRASMQKRKSCRPSLFSSAELSL